jgi:hypothetical protein
MAAFLYEFEWDPVKAQANFDARPFSEWRVSCPEQRSRWCHFNEMATTRQMDGKCCAVRGTRGARLQGTAGAGMGDRRVL